MDLSTEDRYVFLLSTLKTLHDNGHDTSGTLAVSAQLANRLGIAVTLLPEWGELFLLIDGLRLRAIQTSPDVVNMNRVVATLGIVDAIDKGSLTEAQAAAALTEARRAPESNIVTFVLACAFGAAALSIINGATHFWTLTIIGLCAALGAVLRRAIAARTANSLMQIFAASLLAGLVGAAGIAAHLSSSLRLVALGPLLVLNPGPAILGGLFDLVSLRFSLGWSRLAFGLVTILAICAGVLIGLGAGEQALPPLVEPPSPTILVDAVCAGVAAAAYGIFYSMPAQMLIYPVAFGVVAHAIRYWAISNAKLDNAVAAGLACLFVGVVLVPIARRLRLPFAAVGFASVVSMVPGIYLFRLGGGLVEIIHAHGAALQPAIDGVISDGATALLTVATMCLGLVLPKSLYDHYATIRNTRS